MNRILSAIAILIISGASALAATVVNKDAETRTLIVTEGSTKVELPVEPGASIEFCTGGCFVTTPDGDRHALTGAETIEISDGKGRLR